MQFGKTVLVVLFSMVYVPLSYVVMGVGGLAFIAIRALGISHAFAYKRTAGLAMKLCVYMTLSKVRVIYDPNFDAERRSIFA